MPSTCCHTLCIRNSLNLHTAGLHTAELPAACLALCCRSLLGFDFRLPPPAPSAALPGAGFRSPPLTRLSYCILKLAAIVGLHINTQFLFRLSHPSKLLQGVHHSTPGQQPHLPCCSSKSAHAANSGACGAPARPACAPWLNSSRAAAACPASASSSAHSISSGAFLQQPFTGAQALNFAYIWHACTQSVVCAAV